MSCSYVKRGEFFRFALGFCFFFRVEIYGPVPLDLCRTIQEQLARAGDPAAYSHRSGGLDHTVPTRRFPREGLKGQLKLCERQCKSLN